MMTAMKNFIPQYGLILTLFLSLSITSCKSSADHLKDYRLSELKLDSGTVLKVYIAESREQQSRGLSQIKSNDFGPKETMLFPLPRMKYRQFWMPETHFDLDIIFMNADYYVLDIHRKLKHYPKKNPRSKVPMSKEVFSQHVLEIRSDSPHAKEIQPGMTLKFQ